MIQQRLTPHWEAALKPGMVMQDNAPWVLIKGSDEDKQKCGALLNACAGLCVLLAALVEPYMPSVTWKVPIPAHVKTYFHNNT
jgi:methionyl-tRNA synthetase